MRAGYGFKRLHLKAGHMQSCLTLWLFVLYSIILLFYCVNPTWQLNSGLTESEAACEVMCDLWLRNVFPGCLIHLHLLPVVIVLQNINSNSSRWMVACSSQSKHTRVVWNDSHHSNFVSVRDHVNQCYRLLSLNGLGTAFLTLINCG